MGFFKNFANKAKELNEKLNSEGGLVEKIKELKETGSNDGADAFAKYRGAGKFITDLGILRKLNADHSDNIESDDEEESLDSADYSELRSACEEYKKRFEEENGISHEEFMADITGDTYKPLDEETIDFLNNYGKE